MADQVFGMGPMEVDVAQVGILILFCKPSEPENSSENGVIAGLALPNLAGEAAFETGKERSTLSNFLADDELSGGCFVRPFFKADAVGCSGYWSFENDSAFLG